MKLINNLYKIAALVPAIVLLSLTACGNGTTEAPPVPVTIADIRDVAPFTGEAPATAITKTEQYTGTVEWFPAVQGAFDVNIVYTAAITLTATKGYTFQGVGENFFTVEDAVMVINDANSGVITAVFPRTVIPAVIGKYVYVSAPGTGEAPETAINAEQYNGTVTWSPAVQGAFAPNTVYTAVITLTAKRGYTLQGVGENFFTVAGAESVTNAANTGVITAVFSKTGENPNDLTELLAWLNARPPNTADTPITVKLNVSSLGEYSSNSVGSIIMQSGRYVYLDLSGSTFTSIGSQAFWNCTGLTSVTIPNIRKTARFT